MECRFFIVSQRSIFFIPEFFSSISLGIFMMWDIWIVWLYSIRVLIITLIFLFDLKIALSLPYSWDKISSFFMKFIFLNKIVYTWYKTGRYIWYVNHGHLQWYFCMTWFFFAVFLHSAVFLTWNLLLEL